MRILTVYFCGPFTFVCRTVVKVLTMKKKRKLSREPRQTHIHRPEVTSGELHEIKILEGESGKEKGQYSREENDKS